MATAVAADTVVQKREMEEEGLQEKLGFVNPSLEVENTKEGEKLFGSPLLEVEEKAVKMEEESWHILSPKGESRVEESWVHVDAVNKMSSTSQELYDETETIADTAEIANKTKRDNDETTMPEEVEIGLDKLNTEENKKVEINNHQEDGNGTAEGEKIIELASTDKAITEENNSSTEDIGKPSKMGNEMQEAEEPSKVLDKDDDGGKTQEEFEGSGIQQNIEPTTFSKELISNKSDEDVLKGESEEKTSHSGNTNGLQEKQLQEEMATLTDIVEDMSENKIENDETLPVEPEAVLDKQAPEETNMVEIDNTPESLKNNEDGIDGTDEVEKAIEVPSVAKAIEEPDSSAEAIEKPINTEDEMLPAEPEVVLDKQATDETNMVENDNNSHESLKNNEDGNDGTEEVEKAIEVPSVATAIEELNSSAEAKEKPINTQDEMLPAEPEVVLDKLAPEETNVVEIDNTHESLKNDDGIDGTDEVEKAIEVPSVAKAIEEPDSSAEAIEKPINTEDEMLPAETEVVLDKQATEETNVVEIDNSHESLKNNEDGNDGTVEVEKKNEVPSGAKAIEKTNSSAEAIEKQINTDDEMQPVEPEAALDKVAPEETDMVDIYNPRESLKNNEGGNDGTNDVEKAIEVLNCSAEAIEKPINTEDEMLPTEPEVVLDKPAMEETNVVEIDDIDDTHESLKNNEDGNDGTVEVEKTIEVPSVSIAIEEPNSSAESIKIPINTEGEMLPAEPEAVLDTVAPEETDMVDIDNPRESMKTNEDGKDGTDEVEKAIEVPSVAKAIEEPNSSAAEAIEKPINTEDEILPAEPKVVLDKLAPGETSVVEIYNTCESLKKYEDGNDGTDEVEKAIEVPSVAKAFEESNSSVEAIEKPINTEDEMLPAEPEVGLDKLAPEKTNAVEIDNTRESLKNNEDGIDGTDEVEKVIQEPSVAKAIEEPDCSTEAIEKPINTEDEMLPAEPEVIMDKQATEETNVVEIDNSHESLKNNEYGNDGTVEVEKAIEVPSVSKETEEPNSSAEAIKNPINTEDEMLQAEPEAVMDKVAPQETDMVGVINPRESLKNNEDGNDGTDEVKKAIEIPSVAKAIEEPNSSAEAIEKPINTEDEMLPAEPEVGLDKQATDETNMVEIDNSHESLRNNEDDNDGTDEVEKVIEVPSVMTAIEEPNCSAEAIEKPINTRDEMLPAEPEVVLDKLAPEETNVVDIDNTRESLKNNEDGIDGVDEVEKAIEVPSVVKAIEEPDSSAEAIEKPINTEDEMLPVEPEVVLDKQATEETNVVEIENTRESLKTNEDGIDGTDEDEKAIQEPSVAKAIEEPDCSAEAIEKPINTEDEILPAEPEVVMDKQATEETNMVEIDNTCESLKNNEDGNDGTVTVEKAIEVPSLSKAIEEPDSSAEAIKNPINTEDEMLPAEPEAVLDKVAPEETDMVGINNPYESLKKNENGIDGTDEVDKAIEVPSVAKAIEEPDSSAEAIEKPINTEDEMPEVVLDKQATEETNMVEIDNTCESLKNNEVGNDGTVVVEKVIDVPSVAKAIEEPNSSAEAIENAINAEDEMLPAEPEVVLDKLAPEETNVVEIDNTYESLKNNEDGIGGTDEVEKAIEVPSVAKAIEEPDSSAEPIEKPMNTEGTSETKRENDDKTLPVEPEVVLNELVPEEKTVEIDNPHEFLKCDEEGSDETVEGENIIELPSVSKAIVEQHNGSQEPIGKPSKTGDEMPEKLLSEGENREGQNARIILNRGIPLNETKQEAEEPSNVLDKDDDTCMTPEEISVQADAVINSAADLTENLKDSEELGEACKEQDKLSIPEGKDMDSMVVESSDDKEYGRVEKEECFAETSKIAPMGIQNLCSDSKNFQGGTGSHLSTSATEETGSVKAGSSEVDPESVKASFDKIEGETVKEEAFSQDKRDQICTQIEHEIKHNDRETENVHGVDDLLGSQLVASEITETTLDEAAPITPEPADSAPPREVFTEDLQGGINTNDNDNSNQSKILEQDTIVDGNLSAACKAQENPKEKLSDLITEHEGNFPKESEEPVSTEASRGLYTDGNETTAECEVTSQMKQHGIAEMSEDDADSKNSICQNEAEKNLNAAQEEIERSCLQQNTESTTFGKELISEQSNEGILEAECEDKASHSQNTDEGITLQKKQLHEEVATIADIAEGTSETKRESDEKTLPDEHEVMLDKLALDESKKVEIGNPHEILKSNEEGSDGTVEAEKIIELPSVAHDIIEENNRSTEHIENPSKTEDELPEKLFSEGENREGQDTGIILNREIPPNESQPEAEEPSKLLEKDDDEGMTPQKTFVQADAVINCPADFTENLKQDGEKSGEVCNENDSTQSILATKTSFPNDDSNETNVWSIEDKEQDKDFIPKGENMENMDSLVVESHDDKEDGNMKKEESLAETCKIPLMEIQSQSSDSKDAHIVISSPLSNSPTEEIGSEKAGSSQVEPESIKASSDTMEDEIVKQEIFSHRSSSCQISSQIEHNIEHDEVETETIQGVNDLQGGQLVSPKIKETGLGEGTPVSEKTADPAPLIEVHGTVLEGGIHMNENEDHQCKIIEKDNIADDSVTKQEENITRAGEKQASEEESRGLHRDENETVAAHDVISEVEQQNTVELSKDDKDSKDSLFKYESEEENLHAPCEETEKAALPQNADQTAFNKELISVKDDEALRGESEDKAAHSDNNGETNPQETDMLTVDLDEAKSIQHNENSAWDNYSMVDENEISSTPTGEARGNEEDAKESKKEIKEPVTEAIYHNFQTTHADTEEQVASSMEEETPITKIVNETTISETSSPLWTREFTVTKEILLEEEHSGIYSEGRSLNDLEEEKLELNKKSLEHRTEDLMINSSDSTTKVHPESVQPDEELIPSSQSVAEEGDESIISDGALTSSAEDTCPQKVTNTSSKPESIVLEKTRVGSRNEEIKEECTTAEGSKMEPQECTFGEKTFYTQSVENEKIIEVGTAETSKDEDSKMFQDKLVPENSNVEPKNLDASYSTDKEIQGAGMDEAYIETSELDSEKSDHVIESAPKVHKLEMPLEAEKIGLVEEHLAETEIEEIMINKTNEENDIIKANIPSEQTQIADQSVTVKSSLDCPEEVLSLGAYQEDELKPEENELEENESIKEEASSDDKAGDESSAAQDSKVNILHAIESAVAEESHDGNGKEISEMPMLQEQVKHSIADEKQNEELQCIVDGADTGKTLEEEKPDSCTEVQEEGITGEVDRSQKTVSSTPNLGECVQLMQPESVLTAVQPEIQELEREKVSGAPSETEMNQIITNEMSTNTSEETSHEHRHDEIQIDVIANSQALAHVKDSDITEEECPLDLKVTNIEQDECSASESCKAVPTEAILNISTEGSASKTEKYQCTKPELQEENDIKSLMQGPGETTMEMAGDGETDVQQKNPDFSFNIKDSAMENSSTETEQKDVQDNIDIIESAHEHVSGHPYELQNDEAEPTKIQNDNSTVAEEKGFKNEATEAASNEAADLECGEDAKTEVEVNKVTDRSQTMESPTLSGSNLMLGSIEESSQVKEHEDTKSQTEKLCDFTHNKDSEMTQPREFPFDFTEIKNNIDDKQAQHESVVAILDTEFPTEADPHENTEVRTSSEDNDSQQMQQNSEATITHNDLEEMKPENDGETKDNFEGLVCPEEKRTVDHCREKMDISLTQSTILQGSTEQILKPKLSEDNEAENVEQIKSMQEEVETKNMVTVDLKDMVQSMQEKETVVLSAPRKDGEDTNVSTDEDISTENINVSQLPQDKCAETFQFEAEQMKEDAKAASTPIKIQDLEQERTTKAEAALEGSAYIEENRISDDCRKMMETAEMDQTVNVTSEDPVQVTQNKHEEETPSEGKVVLETHEDSTIKTYQALDEPIEIEDFVHISQNKHEEETTPHLAPGKLETEPNENADGSTLNANENVQQPTSQNTSSSEIQKAGDEIVASDDSAKLNRGMREEEACHLPALGEEEREPNDGKDNMIPPQEDAPSKSHQPPIASENVQTAPQFETAESQQARDETIESGSTEEMNSNVIQHAEEATEARDGTSVAGLRGREVIFGKEEEQASKVETEEHEEARSDQEEEEGGGEDSGPEAPVIVENAAGDADVKAGKKKHHNILSGVGSKVKHSIAKVKKVITGKSSPTKQHSPKI